MLIGCYALRVVTKYGITIGPLTLHLSIVSICLLRWQFVHEKSSWARILVCEIFSRENYIALFYIHLSCKTSEMVKCLPSFINNKHSISFPVNRKGDSELNLSGLKATACGLQFKTTSKLVVLECCCFHCSKQCQNG